MLLTKFRMSGTIGNTTVQSQKDRMDYFLNTELESADECNDHQHLLTLHLSTFISKVRWKANVYAIKVRQC
jgi:hypothetical protein